ncbi:aspartate carbamoyltransferase catalytic subunit [Bacillus sp. E214]|uniref:aspartate carbamoyltransferase catalytic subunit n=1 Tax=Bacillus sp. E214 TaxID=2587156 RepID=UPI0011DF9990|nr:aspartate carbamoyltransferase catalytic subunit [Bacillus sp. E214]
MKHLLTMTDLSIEEITGLLSVAEAFANGETWMPAKRHFVANLFFEASTRTKISFEMAQRKLGLDVIPFEVQASSVLKGETLSDTVKTLEAIGVETVVIRHTEDNYFANLIQSGVYLSIMNAGDGCGHHPTQCLLDLMTIKQEFQTFRGLKVAIIGDIRHSRVARSNAETLTRLGAKVVFSGPQAWANLSGSNVAYEPIDDAIENADVVMLLRIQHERHSVEMPMRKMEYLNSYGLTIERERRLRSNCIIMHPAPVNRGVEIDDSLVECARSRIFKQMANGVYVRMAALKNSIEQRGGAANHEYNYKKCAIFN